MLTLNLIKYKEYYSVGYLPLGLTVETPAEARAIMANSDEENHEEYGFTLKFGRNFQWLLPDNEEIDCPVGFWNAHQEFRYTNLGWDKSHQEYNQMKKENAKKFGFVFNPE